MRFLIDKIFYYTILLSRIFKSQQADLYLCLVHWGREIIHHFASKFTILQRSTAEQEKRAGSAQPNMLSCQVGTAYNAIIKYC